MINHEQILEIPPYSLCKKEKEELLTECLLELTRHHMKSCRPYENILKAENIDLNNVRSYTELPFLPVRMFKDMELKSVLQGDVIKTMTSSGTTGQQVSKIYLDKKTSKLQSKALAKIVGDFIGNKRLPMLILDSSAVIRDRKMFSARGAGILGFSIFGRDKLYAFDENMELNAEQIQSFLEKHQGEEIFLFGFTFMIWQHFCGELERTGFHPDLSKGTLIHGGGWKKLASYNISQEEFKQRLFKVCGISRVYDYYGMVEQTGSVYMECEYGHLHTPVFSDVLIRRPENFSLAPVGEEGLIEVASVLPWSYPGHLLLTEDAGMILGEDDCPCKRKGKYFKIKGRIRHAEIRGCSDTYEEGKR